MPISEDEYERCAVNEATSTMSKAELRKSHKPIMEKRRRARINQCLNEIKALILEAMKKDPARHAKLEKADILEMAVKHLQNVQRQQLAIAMAADPSVLRKFKTGFNECAEEVTDYITQIDGRNSGLKQRVSTHLTKCINGIEQIAQLNISGVGPMPFLRNASNIFGATLHNKSNEADVVGDQNNNPQIRISQGIQLIPSRLPSGEIAFLVPNSRNLQCFSNLNNEGQSSQIHLELGKTTQRESAFVSVIPSSTSSNNQESPLKIVKPLSPPLSPNNDNNANDDVIHVAQNFVRTPSPRGFRPVNPALQKSYQSAFISTANMGNKSNTANDPNTASELKNIRYPIHKYPSPRKLVEPLCIITNHSERFKQAQVLDDTANYEENARHGVKRKYQDLKDHQGLLTVASNEFMHPGKVLKTSKDSCIGQQRSSETSPSQFFVKIENVTSHSSSSSARSKIQNDRQQASTSKPTNNPQGESRSPDNSNDMWRPW